MYRWAKPRRKPHSLIPPPSSVDRVLAAMGLSALGIVFGDIGTSPLYTLKTVLDLTGGTPRPDVVLGVLSLILWTRPDVVLR